MIDIYLPAAWLPLGDVNRWFDDNGYRAIDPGYNSDADTWIYSFKDKQTAAHFKLAWGGVVVP